MPSQHDAFTSSVWLRPPRAQTGQPGLTREQMVRAAIEILDAKGTAGLSMRRLGSKLGSGATSLYWHVTHKDELMELVVDEVLAEIYVPEPGDTSWRMAASVSARGMRSTLLRHPWVIAQLGVHPTLGPNAMRLGERMVKMLMAAGFTGMELSHASALLNAHAIGAATTESAFRAATRRAGLDAAGMVEAVGPHLEQAAAGHPEYDRWRRESGVMNQDPDRVLEEAFTFGLERILDGLESWLNAHGAGAAHSTDKAHGADQRPATDSA